MLLTLLVAVIAVGAHALDVGPMDEEVLAADQIVAFMDVLAANAGEARRDQCILPDRPPFLRLVPLAPAVDAIA